MEEVRGLQKLLDEYSSEEACAASLLAAKWPNGFNCERCGNRHAYTITTRKLPLFECTSCRHQSSLIAGTMMEGSRTPLTKWFRALLLIALLPTSINAVQLSDAIRVTYKTAWLMLHKVRYAMNQDESGVLLSGIVRINRAVYGKPFNSSAMWHPKEQPLLIGASLTNRGETAHVKIKVVAQKHLRGWSITPDGTKEFIKKEVEAGAVDVQCITARFSAHRFKQLLDIVKEANNWIKNKFNGIGPKHLQAYLDEFSYRFNQKLIGSGDSGDSMFTLLINRCANSPSLTYSSLICHKHVVT